MLRDHFDDRRPGPLSSICVLDLTQFLAGPFGTQILADLGATVIKVEALDGDMTRAAGPFHPADADRRHAGYFHSVNRNKRSIAVDLKTDEGKAIVRKLARECDVLVENYKAGTLESFGLSYESLQAENERLIYGALRGFGDPRSGASPYGDWPAYDVVAQAMGGICGVTGPGPGQPTKIGPGIGDIVPGIYLTVGILAALIDRQFSGKGQFVDVGMVDAILAICERIVFQKFFAGVTAGPPGNHQPFLAPFGIFGTRDGHAAIGASTARFFPKFCELMEAPELAEDPRFSTIDGRRTNRAALIDEVEARTARFTKKELMDRLGGKVPLGPVYDMDDIIADEHFRVRGMLAELDLPDVDADLAVAGQPIKMSRHPQEKLRPGPGLGADTATVLGALGYPADEVENLRTAGVVR